MQRYEYDSFGQITYVQDSNFVQPYTYTGREYDDESGLYYYRARYYDSKIGRFISEDPIGLEGGDINLYSYVGNNPVNFTDPLGLSPIITNPPSPPDQWPPPLPNGVCEAKCYAGLVSGYYWCNVAWSYGYLNDPLRAERYRRVNIECKQKVYKNYKRCMNDCKCK